MADTVRVKYKFTPRADVFGEMEIPSAMFDRVSKDEEWSDEIEAYILGTHDYLHQPPEISDSRSDCDFDFVERVKAKKQSGGSGT